MNTTGRREFNNRGGSRKKYLGGVDPHHLGGNNEQNYCVHLSSIKQLMYRNYPEFFLRGGGKIWGPVPPWPQPRIATVQQQWFDETSADYRSGTGRRCCLGVCTHHSPNGSTFCAKWRHLEIMTSCQNRLCIYLKNNPAEFHPDPSWNDGDVGFFEARRNEQGE